MFVGAERIALSVVQSSRRAVNLGGTTGTPSRPICGREVFVFDFVIARSEATKQSPNNEEIALGGRTPPSQRHETRRFYVR